MKLSNSTATVPGQLLSLLLAGDEPGVFYLLRMKSKFKNPRKIMHLNTARADKKYCYVVLEVGGGFKLYLTSGQNVATMGP